jgi:hypothetical protein
MPERFEDRDVKCPYYLKTSANKIVCEGYVNDTSLHFVFNDDKDRHKYLQGICNSIEGCEVCPIHKMLNDMWEALYE